MKVSLFCLLVVMVTIFECVPPTEAGCWDTWSRCTGWSSGFTGILWKSCNDRCKELGKSGGNCVKVDTDCRLSRDGKAYQCQCY